jgi:hypothetical protein
VTFISDAVEAHADLADMWDEARVDLEANPDAVSRMCMRLSWIGAWSGANLMIGFVGGLLTFTVTESGDAANIAALTLLALFNTLWVSVWLRSYRLTEDDDFTGVDLTK